MSPGTILFGALRPRWRDARRSRRPGCTVLVPVPGDLPVFLRLAVDVLRRQEGIREMPIVVVPDTPTAASRAAFADAERDAPELSLRLAELDRAGTLVVRGLRNPHVNHWLQLVRGVEVSTTTHVLLHDADCFLLEPGFVRGLYEECRRRGLAALGVTEVWDAWYRANGFAHVVATWELLFDVAWARRFPPVAHRGQAAEVGGKRHVFDTTLLPQARTPANEIALATRPARFVHFNYVICTYRMFEKARGPFVDEYFRLLLIRLLLDAYEEPASARLPTLAALTRALHDDGGPVVYRRPGDDEHYPEFRGKLEALLGGDVVAPHVATFLRRGIAPFDVAYGWTPPGFDAAYRPAPRRNLDASLA